MARTRISLDSGWTVHVGDDLARPRKVQAKTGTANGWSDLNKEECAAGGIGQTVVESMGPNFQAVKLRPSQCDAEWQQVTVPHDWRIGLKPSKHNAESLDYPKVWQGFFPTGVAYYRKVFKSPTLDLRQHATVTFDGIAGYSDIWFNGIHMGQQSTCYSPLTIDITELLRADEEGLNVLLVRTDSTEAEGWWYEGGGIYRHVWMDTYHDIHVSQDGLSVRTPDVSKEKAKVVFEVEVRNESSQATQISTEAGIEDPETGKEIALTCFDEPTTVRSCGMSIISGNMSVYNPKLWQIGKGGALYKLTVRIIEAGAQSKVILDSASTNFGVRTIEWVDDGILVNDQWTKIHGANIHQDWAVYGVALPDRVVEQKLELCAEMGVNAIRTAHHAPTPELVNHADRMGLLLNLEHRSFNTSLAAVEQIRSLVRRFRNHPSVFMWSIENEEMDFQGTSTGRNILSRLIKEVKAHDRDRPTIFGGCVALDNASYCGLTDVVGMHYRAFFGVLDEAISYVPNRPHVLDEEGLYPSTRGVYQYDKAGARAGSLSTLRDVMMDTEAPSANAALLPANYKITGNIADMLTTAYKHPKVSGVFVWAGLDYVGEPTPLRWPATTSSYGARDICGLPKDYYWLLRGLLRPEPLVHVFPHWTWPGKDGERLPFRAYTNCESVEFVVNGQVVAAPVVASGSLAIAEGGIEYRPGELVARGYKNGKLVATHTQVSAGPAAQIILSADRDTVAASGQDVAFIRVAIADKDGNLVPDAANEVHFEVEGAGHVVGSHNADPSTDDYAAVSSATAFNGFVGVYVCGASHAGDVILRATASGLAAANLTLVVSENELEHQVHVAADEAANKLFGVHEHFSHENKLNGFLNGSWKT